MFYGWKIVAALFVVLTITSGLGFYYQSVLIDALGEKGFEISDASMSVSIFFLSGGLFGPLLAAFIERIDVRVAMISGGIVGGIAIFLIGQATDITQVYAFQCLFGLAFSAAGLLPATTLIARWFEARRAAALSIASTGLSVGGVVVTPLSAALIGTVGFEQASLWLGIAFTLGVVPLSGWVLRASPGAVGLAPDGGEVETGEPAPIAGTSFSDAIRGGYFWGLGIAWVFVMLAQVGGIAHQYGLVSDRLQAGIAPFALGVLPLFSILGRLGGGFVLDRGVPARAFTLAMMVLQALALTLMGLGEHPAILLAGLALFGVTVGNLLMLQPLLIAEAYGSLHYARIYSINNVLTMIGVSVGPLAMGWILAADGGYASAYLLAVASAGVACAVFLVSRPPRKAA